RADAPGARPPGRGAGLAGRGLSRDRTGGAVARARRAGRVGPPVGWGRVTCRAAGRPGAVGRPGGTAGRGGTGGRDDRWLAVTGGPGAGSPGRGGTPGRPRGGRPALGRAAGGRHGG